MFLWYCQAERDTVVPARIYCDDMMLEKEIQKPLNEDIVPHFSTENSDYMEGRSRESSPIISFKSVPEDFPARKNA